MKQTAVEFLVDELNQKIDFIPMDKWDKIRDIVQQAKAMHKEEIIDSFGVGCQVEASRLIGYHKMADQYYNETFGGNNEQR
jgi:predicted Zn-dependent protease with MMP-like domain